MNLIRTLVPPLAGLLLPAIAYGKEKLEYSGYIGTGARYEYNETYFEIFSEAKLKFKIKVADQIKGEVNIEANSNEREVELKEASILFKYNPNYLVKIGNIKKRFGIEELCPSEDLYTIEKSLINRHLLNFGYVGREPSLQIYNESRSYILGLSYNQSHNAIATLRLTRLLGKYKVGINGEYQRYLPIEEKELEENGELNTYVASFDLSREQACLFPTFRDLEIFAGFDPVETQMRKFRGDTTQVFFLGIKSLSTRFFKIKREFIKGLEPLFLFSFLAKDVDKLDVNQIEILGGVNLYFHENVKLRINGELMLANNEYNTQYRTIEGSKAVMEIQLKW